MADQKELSGEVEFIELKPHIVKEHVLRLFNAQIQRDYIVADFATVDGNVLVKLKRKVAGK
jgi:hypothetical protein